MRKVPPTVKLSVKYSPTDYISLISRVDYKSANPVGSTGMLLLQDINLRLRKLPVSIWMRYSIFNTDGYESGLYTWENDLLYSFSIPVLFGTGYRAYIMASWEIAKKAEIRIKYGVTSTSVINGRMKEVNEFKIQFRITI